MKGVRITPPKERDGVILTPLKCDTSSIKCFD